MLQYSIQLALKVDTKTEIEAFSTDELYIRAATVVAVDQLVQEVRKKSVENSISNGILISKERIAEFSQGVNAGEMDQR